MSMMADTLERTIDRGLQVAKANLFRCPDSGLHVWYSKVAHQKKVKRDHCIKCGYARVFRKYTRMPNLDRFFALTQEENGHLMWTGGRNDKGYPLFNAYDESGRMRPMGAHRWIFREKFGYLPQVVMHTCDTPLCVFWDHLVPGTHAANMADMIAKGRADHTRATSRLTPDQVREIRHRRALGESCRTLAEEFKTSVNAIRNCVNLRTYKDIL